MIVSVVYLYLRRPVQWLMRRGSVRLLLKFGAESKMRFQSLLAMNTKVSVYWDVVDISTNEYS